MNINITANIVITLIPFEPISEPRITEEGDRRITEEGDQRITQEIDEIPLTI